MFICLITFEAHTLHTCKYFRLHAFFEQSGVHFPQNSIYSKKGRYPRRRGPSRGGNQSNRGGREGGPMIEDKRFRVNNVIFYGRRLTSAVSAPENWNSKVAIIIKMYIAAVRFECRMINWGTDWGEGRFWCGWGWKLWFCGLFFLWGEGDDFKMWLVNVVDFFLNRFWCFVMKVLYVLVVNCIIFNMIQNIQSKFNTLL